MDKLLGANISVERFAAYLDGNLSADEMLEVSTIISGDRRLLQIVEANDIVTDAIGNYLPVELDIPIEILQNDFSIPKINDLFSDDLGDSFLLQNDSIKLDNQNESNMSGNNTQWQNSNAELKDQVLQQYPDSCAIKSQQLILEANGINVTENDLVEESIEKGWYSPGKWGTEAKDVGNLLEEHGMKVYQFENPTIDDIAAELAKGHQVIVGIDSGELWEPSVCETLEDFFKIGGADHALIVSGIQINPLTAEREIVLTDPGTGEIAHTYNMEQFEDAWDDSGHFMISSNI